MTSTAGSVSRAFLVERNVNDGTCQGVVSLYTGNTAPPTVTASPNTCNVSSPRPGSIYIDTSTGSVYVYNSGDQYTFIGTIGTGGSDPNGAVIGQPGVPTTLVSPIYIDSDTRQVYIYDPLTQTYQETGLLGFGADFATVSGNPNLVSDPVITAPIDGLIVLNTDNYDLYQYDAATDTYNLINSITSVGGANFFAGPVTPPGIVDPLVYPAGSIFFNTVTGDFYQQQGNTFVLVPAQDPNTGPLYNGNAPPPAGPIVTDPNQPTSVTNPSAGQYYLDTSTGDLYQFDGTTYNIIYNIAGSDLTLADTSVPATGPNGSYVVSNVNGQVYQITGVTYTLVSDIAPFFSAAGAPPAVTANTGQAITIATPVVGTHYFNTNTGQLYRYDAGVAYTLIYTPSIGNVTVEDVTNAPPPGVARNGQYAIDPSNNLLYQVQAGNWVLIPANPGSGPLFYGFGGTPPIVPVFGTAISPSNPTVGTYYLNTQAGELYQYDGASYVLVYDFTSAVTGAGPENFYGNADPTTFPIIVYNPNLPTTATNAPTGSSYFRFDVNNIVYEVYKLQVGGTYTLQALFSGLSATVI